MLITAVGSLAHSSQARHWLPLDATSVIIYMSLKNSRLAHMSSENLNTVVYRTEHESTVVTTLLSITSSVRSVTTTAWIRLSLLLLCTPVRTGATVLRTLALSHEYR